MQLATWIFTSLTVCILATPCNAEDQPKLEQPLRQIDSSTVVVKSDVDCKLVVNGVDMGALAADRARAFKVAAGVQHVKCADASGHASYATAKVNSGRQTVVILTVASHAMKCVMDGANLVATYLGRERALAKAIVAGDQDKVRGMVDKTFTSDMTQDRVEALEDWLSEQLQTPWKDAFVRELTVREYEVVGLVEVNFALEGSRGKRGAVKHRVEYISDVWQGASGKLVSRSVVAISPRRSIEVAPLSATHCR